MGIACFLRLVLAHGKMPASPQGDQGMSMLDGVSQCWWISKTCVVNWDAWAAIGSFVAAGVAIVLGLMPVLLRRSQAKSVARIAVAKLEQQRLHAGASKCVVSQPEISNGDMNVAWINLEHLDASALRELIQYFDVLPARLRDLVAACIVDVDTCRKLSSQTSYRDKRKRLPSDELITAWKQLVTSVDTSLTRTCQELAKYTGTRLTLDDAAPERMGVGLIRLAESAEKNENVTEDWLRERIVGRVR